MEKICSLAVFALLVVVLLPVENSEAQFADLNGYVGFNENFNTTITGNGVIKENSTDDTLEIHTGTSLATYIILNNLALDADSTLNLTYRWVTNGSFNLMVLWRWDNICEGIFFNSTGAAGMRNHTTTKWVATDTIWPDTTLVMGITFISANNTLKYRFNTNMSWHYEPAKGSITDGMNGGAMKIGNIASAYNCYLKLYGLEYNLLNRTGKTFSLSIPVDVAPTYTTTGLDYSLLLDVNNASDMRIYNPHSSSGYWFDALYLGNLNTEYLNNWHDSSGVQNIRSYTVSESSGKRYLKQYIGLNPFDVWSACNVSNDDMVHIELKTTFDTKNPNSTIWIRWIEQEPDAAGAAITVDYNITHFAVWENSTVWINTTINGTLAEYFAYNYNASNYQFLYFWVGNNWTHNNALTGNATNFEGGSMVSKSASPADGFSSGDQITWDLIVYYSETVPVIYQTPMEETYDTLVSTLPLIIVVCILFLLFSELGIKKKEQK